VVEEKRGGLVGKAGDTLSALKRLLMVNRREFIKGTVGAIGALAAGGAAVGATGCASSKSLVRPGVTPLDKLLEQGARLMWVGAHPDDESLISAIAAKAGPKLGNPLYFLVLTHGDGGECLLPGGCLPDLATVRGKEMAKVAELYRAELQHEFYWNAPLPVESFPKRHLIAKRWVNEEGDPTILIAKAIRRFRPDALVTFAPIHGFTGHPEHQLASRFTTAAVRAASAKDDQLPGEPHRVENVYFGLNRYWALGVLGGNDPFPYTERFDARQPCINGMSCIEVGAENTRPHRTQKGDMDGVRLAARFIRWSYLYRADPFTEVFDPFEEMDRGGMV
jgi:LmbE family N-acetylglucosaminyl deacetylase